MTTFTVNARKFNGRIHKTWQAELISQNEDLLVLLGKFGSDIKHPYLNVIRRGTVSYEFFWLKKWFNVFRFHEPNGQFRIFYCNINLPPTISDNTLDYVDLDIDVIVQRDMSYRILDLEEFRQNSLKFPYPEEVTKKCLESLCELQFMIKNRLFPFDFFKK
jgi:uncharacterized protein